MKEKNTEIISLAEASRLTGYNQDYLGQLARAGKFAAEKVGRNWVTSKGAVDALLTGESPIDTRQKHKVRVAITKPFEQSSQDKVHLGDPLIADRENPSHFSKPKLAKVLGVPIMLTEKAGVSNRGNLAELRQRVEHFHLQKQLEHLQRKPSVGFAHKAMAMQGAVAMLFLVFAAALGWQAERKFSLFEKFTGTPTFFASTYKNEVDHNPQKNGNLAEGLTDESAALVASEPNASAGRTGQVLGEKIILEPNADGSPIIDLDIIDQRVLFNLGYVINQGWIRPRVTVHNSDGGGGNTTFDIGSTVGSATDGSVLFAGTGGVLAQDNANFFWDDTADALGIGTNTIAASAILQIDSTSKGFLPPRMTEVQRDAIVGPVEGLLVYNTTSDELNIFDGTVWSTAGGGGSSALSDITAATGNATIASGANNITWNWQLTGAETAFTFGESVASTGGASNQFILQASTLASSTAIPFYVQNLGAALSFQVDDEAGDTTPFVINANGSVGIGTTAPDARLELASNISQASWTTDGIQLQAAAATYTDTTGAGAITDRVVNSFGQPTLAASNPVTLTNAATLYVANAPAAGANTTITNAYALWVDGGTTRLDGNLIVNGTSSINPGFTTGSVIFQGASGLAQDNASFFWNDTDNRLGIRTANPLGFLHVGGALNVASGGLSSDDIIIEEGDAIAGLYSNSGGTFGSGLILAEVDGGGALVDKWALVRETTGGGSGLRLTYGTNAAYASNATQVIFGNTGSVGIGNATPGAFLHVNNTTTRTLSANADGFTAIIQGNFTEAASGTHALIAGLEILPPTINGAAATVTNTASFYIQDAASATVTGANYALWVDSGSSRFDGDVEIRGASNPLAIYLGASDTVARVNVDSTGILRFGASGGIDFYDSNGTALGSRYARITSGQGPGFLAGNVPIRLGGENGGTFDSRVLLGNFAVGGITLTSGFGQPVTSESVWAPNAVNTANFVSNYVNPTLNAGGSNSGGNFYGMVVAPYLQSTTGISNTVLFDVGTNTGGNTFPTNYSSKFSILSSGNVGIGTSAPTNLLTVSKTIVGADRTGGGAIDLNTIFGGTEFNTARITTGSPLVSNADGYLGFWTRPLGGGAVQERLTIDPSGNVSIGTASAVNSRLVVLNSGTTDALISQWRASNGNDVATFRTSDSGIFGIHAQNNADIYIRDTSDNIGFYLQSGGNVGIGTATPSHKLHVQALSGSSNLLLLANNDYNGVNTGSGVAIVTGATTGNTYTRIQAFGQGGSDGQDLILQPIVNEVGIGVVDPVAKLQVSPQDGTTAFRLDYKSTPAAYNLSVVQGVNAGDVYWRFVHRNDNTDFDSLTFRLGNIGIGTINPGSLLHVHNTATRTIASNANAATTTIQGTFTEAGSGTHTRISGLELLAPTINNAAAAVTETATLYIDNAPAATGATEYAIVVDDGDVRFDGNLQVNGGTISTTANTLELDAGGGTINFLDSQLLLNGTTVLERINGDPDLAIAENFQDIQFRNTGVISAPLGSTASTTAVCSSLALATAPTAGVQYELRDCSGAPAADYMEMYPGSTDLVTGDVVMASQSFATTTKGDRVSKLVKTSAPYQSGFVGVVSNINDATDFNSIGYNIREQDSPVPVALAGRVKVNLANNTAPIRAGDPITTSATRGKAMKATSAGPIIGYALENYQSGSIGSHQVMIFINPTYYVPSIASVLQDQDGELASMSDTFVSMNVTDGAAFGNIAISGSAVISGSLVVADKIKTPELITEKLVTKELCIEDVCINKEQLQNLLNDPQAPTIIPESQSVDQDGQKDGPGDIEEEVIAGTAPTDLPESILPEE